VANPLSNKISPVMAMQIYRACVLGSTNYLLALIEPTKANLSTLDRHTKRMVEQCMPMRNSTRDAVWGDCRLPRAEGILARERARFTLHCEGLPLPGSIICSLASKLKFEAAAVGMAVLSTRTRQPYYWFWRTIDLFKEIWVKHQIPPQIPCGGSTTHTPPGSPTLCWPPSLAYMVEQWVTLHGNRRRESISCYQRRSRWLSLRRALPVQT
jgi:hypothetical protein